MLRGLGEDAIGGLGRDLRLGNFFKVVTQFSV